MNYIPQAKAMIEKGLVPIPLKVDSKMPSIKWKQFQDRFPTEKEVEKHFKDCGGVAALTLPGKDKDNLISDLFLLDFDLKYQLPHQDFFTDFGNRIPIEIKRRFLINQTSSGVGRHIWFRVENYFAKSSKLSFRLKTPEEILEQRQELVKMGVNLVKANHQVMKKPFEVVIETRGSNSYGVFIHPTHKRVYGKRLHTMNEDEMEIIMAAAYETCEFFEKKEKVVGNVKHYGIISRYNQDATPADVMQLLSGTGMIREVSTDYEGNITFLRTGSKAKHSGKIFMNTSAMHVFSDNTPMFDVGTYAPFDVYCTVNNYTKQKAIYELQQ